MTRLKTLALLSATAMIAVAAQPALAETRAATLDQVLAFDNPADPWLSQESDQLFSRVWTKASTGLSVPGVGFTKISTSTDAANGWTQNTLALAGEWHGLTLTGFSLNGVPHSGVGAYVLHFDESAANVVARLDGMGFPIAKVGSEARSGDADCGTRMRVDPQGGGSTFTIAFAC